MPAHTVWLARALTNFKMAMEWLGLVDDPAKPITLLQRAVLCIDMAQSWQAAASMGLNQGAKPEIAFPRKPDSVVLMDHPAVQAVECSGRRHQR